MKWVLTLLVLTACTGPARFSAPAPEGALDCALREAKQRGYQPVEGSVENGMVLVGIRTAPRPDDDIRTRPEVIGDVATTDYAKVPRDGQLRLRQGHGMLRIEVISERNLSGRPEGTATTADDGRQLLALCSTP